MEPRREKRWEHIAETIRLVLLPGWRLILLLSLAIALFVYLQWSGTSRPRVTREARIVRFGSIPTEPYDDSLVITVRYPDGTMADLLPARESVPDCRTGDRIIFTGEPGPARIDRCTRPTS